MYIFILLTVLSTVISSNRVNIGFIMNPNILLIFLVCESYGAVIVSLLRDYVTVCSLHMLHVRFQ